MRLNSAYKGLKSDRNNGTLHEDRKIDLFDHISLSSS